MSNEIEVGDTIHARFYGDSDGANVAMQDFVVSEIISGEGGLTYLGGAIPADPSWSVELSAKSFENLKLPETLSEITAYDHNGEATHLMGKASSWMTLDGISYSVDRIRRWSEGHI